MALFVQAMLCKVTEYIQETTITPTASMQVRDSVVRFNLDKQLVGKEVKLTYNSSYVQNTGNQNFILWNNNGNVTTFTFQIEKATREFTKTLSEVTAITKFTGNHTQYSSYQTYIYGTNYYKITVEFPFTASRNKWKPRELQNIGIKASTTIFWVHIDNTRITQDA